MEAGEAVEVGVGVLGLEFVVSRHLHVPICPYGIPELLESLTGILRRIFEAGELAKLVISDVMKAGGSRVLPMREAPRLTDEIG